MNFILSIFNIVGVRTLNSMHSTGKWGIFVFEAITKIFSKPFFKRIFFQNLIHIGFYSLPLIGLASLFSGAVLALQSYSGFSRFSAETTIPSIVILSLTRELAPVLTGLVISGRVGASMAAEIGTMRVSEQIDALYTLSTNSIRYLITPRVLACCISLPILVFIADIIGVMGGYLVSVTKLNFNPQLYIIHSMKYLKFMDVVSGLVKALFFGFIISSVSCFYGYYAQNGAQGVGKATTVSVVTSSILILLSNYFITQFFI